jgi:hypothetical protein
VHPPIKYFVNEIFGQQIQLGIAQPTFYTSLVNKHFSTVNLVQSSTYILNLE